MQIIGRPKWALNTLKHGKPEFETLKPYMPPGLDMKQLGMFMDRTFSGRLNEEKIKPIRDMWPGKLVIKGVACEADAERAVRLGVDGLWVSNHGGRQLDAGQSAIAAMRTIADKFKGQATIMMDSGIRSGPDIARTMASGAEFTMLGRTFMYGTAALGEQGGNHTICLLYTSPSPRD